MVQAVGFLHIGMDCFGDDVRGHQPVAQTFENPCLQHFAFDGANVRARTSMYMRRTPEAILPTQRYWTIACAADKQAG